MKLSSMLTVIENYIKFIKIHAKKKHFLSLCYIHNKSLSPAEPYGHFFLNNALSFKFLE